MDHKDGNHIGDQNQNNHAASMPTLTLINHIISGRFDARVVRRRHKIRQVLNLKRKQDVQVLPLSSDSGCRRRFGRPNRFLPAAVRHPTGYRPQQPGCGPGPPATLPHAAGVVPDAAVQSGIFLFSAFSALRIRRCRRSAAQRPPARRRSRSVPHSRRAGRLHAVTGAADPISFRE